MAVTDIQEIKEKLALAVRIMVNEELIEVVGHPSARIPGTDHVCVLGHLHGEGHTLRETTAENIITVDMDGKLIEGNHEPVKEIYIHTEIYRARRDVNSVWHTHSPVTIALGLAGVPVTAFWPHAIDFAEGVPIFDSAHPIVTPELGKKLAKVLGRHTAVMQKGHGAVCVGSSIEQAGSIALDLEKTAQVMLMVGQFTKVQPMSDEALAAFTGSERRHDPEAVLQGFWTSYKEMLPK